MYEKRFGKKVPNLFLLLPRNILVGNIGGKLSFIIDGCQNMTVKSIIENIADIRTAALKFKGADALQNIFGALTNCLNAIANWKKNAKGWKSSCARNNKLKKEIT